MGRFTLPKSERVCRDKTIRRIFTEGRSGFAHPFRYFWLVSEAESGVVDVRNAAGAATAGTSEITDASGTTGEGSMSEGADGSSAAGRAGKRDTTGAGLDDEKRTEKAVGVVEKTQNEVAVAVLFSVPKKQFKRAVKRNLLKRRTREAYRLSKATLYEAARAKHKRVELALVYTSKELSDFKTIEDGVKRILEKIGRCL